MSHTHDNETILVYFLLSTYSSSNYYKSVICSSRRWSRIVYLSPKSDSLFAFTDWVQHKKGQKCLYLGKLSRVTQCSVVKLRPNFRRRRSNVSISDKDWEAILHYCSVPSINFSMLIDVDTFTYKEILLLKPCIASYQPNSDSRNHSCD